MMIKKHWYLVVLLFILNAGDEFTVAEMEKMCNTFKEVGIEEPNWQVVSRKLGLVLYGQVLAAELYQAWSNPSWGELSQALGEFPEYKKVAEQAKIKAGVSIVTYRIAGNGGKFDRLVVRVEAAKLKYANIFFHQQCILT